MTASRINRMVVMVLRIREGTAARVVDGVSCMMTSA